MITQVFGRFPTLEYLGTGGGTTASLVLTHIHHNTQQKSVLGVAMGWGPEFPYVEKIGQHGAYVHASDFAMDFASLSNMNTHASVRVDSTQPTVGVSCG